jgi:branched-chain amino acid transport system substrate-binding protein
MAGLGMAPLAVLLVALGAGCDPDVAPATAPPSPDTVHIGVLGPVSGPAAFLGYQFEKGARLAVQEINAAGGVNGKQLEVVLRDSRTAEADGAVTSIASVNQLADLDAVAIVGPDASAIVLDIKDTIVARHVPLISPTATAEVIATLDDDDLIWRTAASDAVQSRVLARRVHADGHATVAVIYRDDAYGDGLAAAFGAEFAKAGGTVLARVPFAETKISDFDPEVAQLFAAGTPDAIVIIGFMLDSAGVLQALLARSPDARPSLYGVDANHDPGLLKNAPPAILVGMRFTVPVSRGDHNYIAFRDAYRRVLRVDPYRVEFTYDAVYLIALALLQGGANDAAAVRTHLRAASRPDTDTPVVVGVGTDELAKAAAHAHDDLDFQGASGLIDFDDHGDVTNATFAIEDISSDDGVLAFHEIDRVEVP